VDIDKLRKIIDKSIDKVTEKGWSVEPDMWISRAGSTCCPLGSVYLDAIGIPAPTNITSRAAVDCEVHLLSILGMDRDEIYSFSDGYDGQGYDKNKHVFKLWNLGRSYRSKYPRKSYESEG
jgi:hypothetical protein